MEEWQLGSWYDHFAWSRGAGKGEGERREGDDDAIILTTAFLMTSLSIDNSIRIHFSVWMVVGSLYVCLFDPFYFPSSSVVNLFIHL